MAKTTLVIHTSMSLLLGQSASISSKNITQGCELRALWKHCRTPRSLSPTY